MNISVYVSFNEGRKKYRHTRRWLEQIGCAEGLEGEESILCGYYANSFDATDSRLKALRGALQDFGIKWIERVDHHFTDDELRAFPLLSLRSTQELPIAGPDYGTTYDLAGACRCCGTGALQTSPLMLPRKRLPKRPLILATSTELLVAERAAELLRNSKVSGLELRQAVSHTNREPLAWWQMTSAHEMPKISDKSKGIARGDPPPCPQCGQDGHYSDGENPQEIVYDSKEVELAALPDVVHTWERWGRSVIDKEDFKRSRFAEPLILVKPRVFDIFRKLRVKHAVFEPIRIE